MPPEIWQTLRRLLVLCWLSDANGAEQSASALQPVFKTLYRELPDSTIQLLMLQEGYYQFLELDSQMELSPTSSAIPYSDYGQLIETIKAFSFDSAIVFTAPSQSPYTPAYLCYLAGIPIRLGQSSEFGGGVLSHCVSPPLEAVSLAEYQLHLLTSAGFSTVEQNELAIA